MFQKLLTIAFIFAVPNVAEAKKSKSVVRAVVKPEGVIGESPRKSVIRKIPKTDGLGASEHSEIQETIEETQTATLQSGEPCPDNLPYPSVEIHVLKARDYDKDADIWNKPDPYVEVVLHGETKKTSVQHNTYEANFDYKLCFKGFMSVKAYETQGLDLKLFDEDKFSRDDLLGTFHIDALSTGLRDMGEKSNVKVRVFVKVLPASDAAVVALHPKYEKTETVVYYPASYVLPENAEAAGVPPPMQVAPTTDMVDFGGIWWMSDNPVAEELVSFKYATLDSSTFPVVMSVPNARAGMWSWLTDTIGDILRRYYATGDPVGMTDFTFNNSKQGYISTGLVDVPLVWVENGFPFYKYTADCDKTSGDKKWCDPTKCNATSAPGTTCAQLIEQFPNDMWSRPTVFDKKRWEQNVIPCPWAPVSNWKKPWWPDTTYTLKRIVYANGTQHPAFWKEWMEHMKDADGTPGGKMLQSYISDDWCQRIKAAGWAFDLLGGPPRGAQCS